MSYNLRRGLRITHYYKCNEVKNSMKTINKDKYIKVWNSHINQLDLLNAPLLSANKTIELKKLENAINDLRNIVDICADIDFKLTN